MNGIYKAALSIAAAALVGCGGGSGGGGGGAGGGFMLPGGTVGEPAQPAPNAGGGGAAPSPSAGSSLPAPPNDVVAPSTLALDAEAYRKTAAVMSQDAGLSYRYGPAPAVADAGLPTWGKRADRIFPNRRPGETRVGERPCNEGHCGTYQLGELESDPGGYSSNIGHAAYVPDAPASQIGVIDLAISSVSNGVFSQKAELSWVLPPSDDDFNAVYYRDAQKLDVKGPVAVGRCYGRPGWCMNSVMVFQNGLVASTGVNTSINRATTQLAPGKVPTAVAITNSGEFALITVWDTVNLRGEVAVVALAGLADGATVANPNPNPNGDWYGEWRAVHPGLPNLGNYAYMKVLGYVALPAGMEAPTEISVTTGWSQWNALFSGDSPDYISAAKLPLSNEANRIRFREGGDQSQRYAKSGVAVVLSKSQQKAAFIDLRPLFEYYQKMYFGTTADYNVTARVGETDGEWPRRFSAAAEQTPTVIKVIDLPSRPTAVKTYLWGDSKRAWIATQDGTLRIYNLGDYPGTGTRSPASIVETGSVTGLGANPTHITYTKQKANATGYNYDPSREVIVTSRGTRSIHWVRFNAEQTGGSVVRTLQDTRLIDPISAEDNENHTTESYVLSVADYGGKQISNYRFGPVIMWNYPNAQCRPPAGCSMLPGSDGSARFEFGGSYALKGKAFHVVSANIP